MLELPQITTAAELLQAQNLVLQAVARGELATGDGQALMSMMMQIAKTLRLVAQEEHQALADRAHPARSDSAHLPDISGPEARGPEDERLIALAPPPLPPIDLAPFAALKVRPDAAPDRPEVPTKPLEPACASP
jgi:hypothetical protein